jgi:hypothetical protein
MTMTSFYRAFTVGIGLLYGYVNYVGWTIVDTEEVHKVPKTVRDNPGVYRTHYRSHVHYTGGK